MSNPRLTVFNLALAAIAMVFLACARPEEPGRGRETPAACFADGACRQLFVSARRGLPARLPENSLAGYRAALSAGADAIGLELRVTRDGAFVALADATLDRTTSGSGLV